MINANDRHALRAASAPWLLNLRTRDRCRSGDGRNSGQASCGEYCGTAKETSTR
jgi:hypothetical protein